MTQSKKPRAALQSNIGNYKFDTSSFIVLKPLSRSSISGSIKAVPQGDKKPTVTKAK